MNASIATGIEARDYTASADTAWIDLTKGLGAPVGAVLVGSTKLMREARRLKHMFGGAMRQAGIIAAAGVYALEHNIGRLSEDHANAQTLAKIVAGLPGVRLEPPEVDTNMVFFDVSGTALSASDVVVQLLERGVRMGAFGQYRVRAVTHLDVSHDDILQAANSLREVLACAPTILT